MNCLHERGFKLHTSFNRPKPGSTILERSLSFRFVTASRKKSLHICVKSHKVEIKLCNHFISSLKHSMVLQVAKFLAHLSCSIILQWIAFVWCSFATNSNKFWYWSINLASSIETFLSNRYYSRGSTLFHSVVCNTNAEFCQSIEI